MNLDFDLEMTLTFKVRLMKYKHTEVNVSILKFGLDLNPMTLILKLDPDMVKMYLCTENENPSSLKVIARTGRQTHRQTRLKLLPVSICGW